jgi:hypothetical protein
MGISLTVDKYFVLSGKLDFFVRFGTERGRSYRSAARTSRRSHRHGGFAAIRYVGIYPLAHVRHHAPNVVRFCRELISRV